MVFAGRGQTVSLCVGLSLPSSVFRSSVLSLFFRGCYCGCARVGCGLVVNCSPLVAVSLFFVPSVVAHVPPWDALLLVGMSSTNDPN